MYRLCESRLLRAIDLPRSKTHCGFNSPLSSFAGDEEVRNDEDGAWPMSARPPLLAAGAAVADMTGQGMEAKKLWGGTLKEGERRRAGATAKARNKGKLQSKAAAVDVTRLVGDGRRKRMY